MLPALKIYDIDYSFIIKNYLNPEMWQKIWTLFIYKSFIFTLKIYTINCQEEKISFELQLEDTLNHDNYYDDWDSYPYIVKEWLSFSLKIDDVQFLKNKINSSMKNLIYKLETKKIKATDEYKNIEETKNQEENALRNIAEEFLDDNEVTNEEIREVYIDNYINNNLKTEDKLDDFVDTGHYLYLTDLYLIIAEVLDDKTLKIRIETSYNNKEELEVIKQEVQEFADNLETEEFEEEMKDYLEEM